jgi:hypothetical protein
MSDTRTAQKSLSGFPQSQQSPSLIQCSGCQNVWTGMNACHCSGCHRTFTGITAFDIHRTRGRCNEPEDLFTEKGEPRLVAVDKLYWSGWGLPGERPAGDLA